MRSTSCLLLIAVAGCVPSDARFGEVRTTVRERIDAEVAWDGAEGSEREERARELLKRPLGPDEAARVALLRNQELQAAFDELAIENAQLLSASLLPNPHAEAAVGFGHDPPDLHGSLTISLSDLVFLPLARRAASAELDAATFAAAGRVLDTAYDTRVAMHDYIAERQLLALDRAVLEASFLSYDAARRLHEAGNTSDLDFAQRQALYEEARLAVLERELAVMERRERLNVLMGLVAPLTRWESVEALAEPAADDPGVERVEARAVERSLLLAELRERYRAETRRADFAQATGVIPELRAGVQAEREGGEWEVGPVVELEVPLFQQGQAAVAASDARGARFQNLYAASAVRVRAAARATRFRLEVARRRIRLYDEALVPLRERITELTQRQYNGMFVSVFELLNAKRMEIATERERVVALRDYWIARAGMELVVAGQTPATGVSGARGAPASMRSVEEGSGNDEGGH